MGNTYTVEIWKHSDLQGGFAYCEYHRGEVLLKALWMMWKAKRKGFKCVKFEWR